MVCKEGQFDVVELMVNDQFKTFSIDLNAQHANEMTHFDLKSQFEIWLGHFFAHPHSGRSLQTLAMAASALP